MVESIVVGKQADADRSLKMALLLLSRNRLVIRFRQQAPYKQRLRIVATSPSINYPSNYVSMLPYLPSTKSAPFETSNRWNRVGLDARWIWMTLEQGNPKLEYNY